jgi:hypothetical protein
MHNYVCLICAIFLMGCTPVERRACEDFVKGTDTPERIVDDAIIEYLKKVVYADHLQVICFGVEMECEVQKVSIDLCGIRSFNMTQARKFIVQKSEEFLKIINKNQTIKPYIHEYPCGIELLSLQIKFLKPDQTPEDAPYIASVCVRSGKVYYRVHDIKLDVDSVTSETYEEASQIGGTGN